MMPVRIAAPRIVLFGVPIHAVSMTTALDLVDVAIETRHRLHVGVVNAAKVVNMGRDPVLRRDVLSSDLILADGIAIVWASRLLGRALPERVTGIDLMIGILDRGNTHRYSVYCLGASEAVSTKVASRIAIEYPNVSVCGRHHGYFSEADEHLVVADIVAARPDILFVAMTSPKKETFMAKWVDQMNVPVCHGVGGSFDVFAGDVERAPVSWQRLGLEWLYRVKQEPRRLWRRYLTTNLLFFWMVIKELWLRAAQRQATHNDR